MYLHPNSYILALTCFTLCRPVLTEHVIVKGYEPRRKQPNNEKISSALVYSHISTAVPLSLFLKQGDISQLTGQDNYNAHRHV